MHPFWIGAGISDGELQTNDSPWAATVMVVALQLWSQVEVIFFTITTIVKLLISVK